MATSPPTLSTASTQVAALKATPASGTSGIPYAKRNASMAIHLSGVNVAWSDTVKIWGLASNEMWVELTDWFTVTANATATQGVVFYAPANMLGYARLYVEFNSVPGGSPVYWIMADNRQGG